MCFRIINESAQHVINLCSIADIDITYKWGNFELNFGNEEKFVDIFSVVVNI